MDHPPKVSGPLPVEISLRVRVKLENGEVVCIVGNIPELGDWDPRHVHELHKIENSKNYEIWGTKIPVTPTRDIRYRYLTAFKDNTANVTNMAVGRWETNFKARVIYVKDLHNADIRKGSSGEPVQKYAPLEEAVFGFYDGHANVDKGWLTTQTEIRLDLYGNPINVWTKELRGRKFRIKCSTVDIWKKDGEMEIASESSDAGLSTTHATISRRVRISVVSRDHGVTMDQPSNGTVYDKDDYLIYIIQSFYPETVGYQFDFYLHDDEKSNDDGSFVGCAYLLPIIDSSIGIKVIPINGLKFHPVGQLRVEYLLVRPMLDYNCSMDVSFARKWKSSRKPLDVGHRGMGISYTKETTRCTTVRENTIASLKAASSHGADYVEFDVHLSKDNVPVIYHDYNVCLSLKKRYCKGMEWFNIPVHTLSLAQLHLLKLENNEMIDQGMVADTSQCNSSASLLATPSDTQPFPTLKLCFEQLHEDVGFLIEIKYPMILQTGEVEEGMNNFMERNQYLDHILKDLLRHAGLRRVILSCFDANVCTMLRLKQNKYPVILLCQDDNDQYTAYSDQRSQHVLTSISFAMCDRFLGVGVHAQYFLQNVDVVKLTKKLGLVTFCWGTQTNNKEDFDKMKNVGVDAVIFDKIGEFSDKTETIFQMEIQEKLELLSRIGALWLKRSRQRSPKPEVEQ